MRFLKGLLTTLLILALVAFAVLFALSNPTEATVDFLAYEHTATIATWVIGSLALGGLLGLLAGLGVYMRLKASQVGSARKIKQYEQEISKIKIQGTPVKE